MILPSNAAFLINYLCSSPQSAGTVNTHLIFVLTTLPTYSYNFSIAFSEIKRKVAEMIVINGISRPSVEIASPPRSILKGINFFKE